MVKSPLRRWRTAVACFGQYFVAVDSLGQRSTRGSRSCAAPWRSSAAFLGGGGAARSAWSGSSSRDGELEEQLGESKLCFGLELR
jgi:hypothetical protein